MNETIHGEMLLKIKLHTNNKPNYLMIGNGTMNKNKIQSIDLIREVAQATKSAQFVLLAIKDGIGFNNDYHYVVKIDSKELSSTQKQYLVTGYKELYEKGLVKRVKRSHYMINPNALIPIKYEEAIALWDSIK